MENFEEFNALDEGIQPGGLRNKDDIKVLICFILNNVEGSLTREQIGNILQDRGIANYFEVMDAVSDLLSNGNITTVISGEDEYLSITDSGKEAVSLVEKDLPKTVREDALKAAVRLVTIERNMKENDVTIEPADGGYTLSFSMKDKDSVLMELNVFVGDRELAEKIKANFYEDPARVYSGIIASLMIE